MIVTIEIDITVFIDLRVLKLNQDVREGALLVPADAVHAELCAHGDGLLAAERLAVHRRGWG